jgi:flagellar hook protein FlgE
VGGSAFALSARFTAGVWLLGAPGCAGGPSMDERRPADAADEPGSMQAGAGPTLGPELTPFDAFGARAACAGEPVVGFRYAGLPEFWLGSREPTPVAVVGAGFVVSTDAPGGPALARFSTRLGVTVSPEGYLEDAAGYRLLGYLRDNAVGPCVAVLRAPAFADPEATTQIALAMNLDPREFITTFDVANPDATANSSTSLTAFDAIGHGHYVDIYFNNLGADRYEYHVIVDGGDLDGGIPGSNVLVGAGQLQFEASGWLLEVTNPPACLTFAGSEPQCIEVTFPAHVTVGLNSYGQITQFADYTAVRAQTANGFAAGVGESIAVDVTGAVSVHFDNGAALVVGRLALARFAREDALVELDEDVWEATRGSGRPQWGVPGSPGRGSIEALPGIQ